MYPSMGLGNEQLRMNLSKMEFHARVTTLLHQHQETEL